MLKIILVKLVSEAVLKRVALGLLTYGVSVLKAKAEKTESKKDDVFASEVGKVVEEIKKAL